MQVLPATQSDMVARHHELISAHHSGQFAPLPQPSLAGTDTDSLTKPASLLTKHGGGSQASFQSFSNLQSMQSGSQTLQSMQSGSQTLQVPGKQDRWDNRVAAWGSQAVSSVDGQMGSRSGSMRHTHLE